MLSEASGWVGVGFRVGDVAEGHAGGKQRRITGTLTITVQKIDPNVCL